VSPAADAEDTGFQEVSRVEFFFAIAIRSGLSFLFGLLFGFGGLMVARSVIPGFSWSMEQLVWAAGIGAGIAGFLAWLKPEANRRIISIGFVLAIIGALAGSWLGYWYGEVAYPDGVRNVMFVSTGNLRSPAVWTFITGAAIFSTIFGAIYYGFRLWRYHEV
jgi:hypothetical protein